MSQIEVPKVVKFVGVEPPSGQSASPKIVMYAWAMPGEGAAGETQGHVHTQIVRRS